MAKQVKFIDRGGEKFVAKKASWVKKVKIIFLTFTAIWFPLAVWTPLHIKNTFSEPIKKSIVVYMFFDLQQGIADQYAKMLEGIKKSINLEKPISKALQNVKLAEKPVKKANKALSFAGKFGIKSKEIEKAANSANEINKQLAKIEKDLVRTSQTEVNLMIDETIKNQVDKATGGMSSVLLTKYNLKSIAPWRPSTWSVSEKIYNDIERSSKSTVQIIMNTIDNYFEFAAWAHVIVAWLIIAFIWTKIRKKVKLAISPFIVCPNCGHAFSDKRTMLGILRIFKPWEWI